MFTKARFTGALKRLIISLALADIVSPSQAHRLITHFGLVSA
jgi:hypothetical protein